MTRVRVAALALIAVAASFFGSITPASAAFVNVGISVGSPPPPVVVEHPWARPYRTAVWIPGEYQWIRGRWVWVNGYYGYPPRRGAVWVPARYSHHRYYGGYWR